ncbi:hypothetical protein THAOC_06294, partial [Thalassiosira oceanica]
TAAGPLPCQTMEDLYKKHVESFVDKNIIEFRTNKGGLIWKVCGYEYDKGTWNLTLKADEGGKTFEETLPVRDCKLFTPGPITARSNRVEADRLQAGSRIFVKVDGKDRHQRGTIVTKNKNKIEILYDKCERELGGETKEIEIDVVLFDISAAIQDSAYTSYGPLFQKGERIVTDQECGKGNCKGTYRHTVQILGIENDSKDLFQLTNTLHEQMVNGQPAGHRLGKPNLAASDHTPSPFSSSIDKIKNPELDVCLRVTSTMF